MSILLTASFNPGSFDSGKTYTHAKAVKIAVDEVQSGISIEAHWGRLVSGIFVSGILVSGFTVNSFLIQGADYIAIRDLLCSGTDKKIFDEVSRVIEEYLVDKGLIDGEVV